MSYKMIGIPRTEAMTQLSFQLPPDQTYNPAQTFGEPTEQHEEDETVGAFGGLFDRLLVLVEAIKKSGITDGLIPRPMHNSIDEYYSPTYDFKIKGAVWRIDPEGKNHVVSNEFSRFSMKVYSKPLDDTLKEKIRSIGDAFTEGDKKGVFLPLGTTPYDKDIYDTTLHYEVIQYLNTNRVMHNFKPHSSWTKNPNKHKQHMYSIRIFVKMRL